MGGCSTRYVYGVEENISKAILQHAACYSGPRPMTNLEPHKKIRNLMQRLYSIRDKRLIMDDLKEILSDVIALEVQVSELGQENVRLVHEASLLVPEVEVPF